MRISSWSQRLEYADQLPNDQVHQEIAQKSSFNQLYGDAMSKASAERREKKRTRGLIQELQL
jgi:hypothetical protein